jgi:hypothetical protein
MQFIVPERFSDSFQNFLAFRCRTRCIVIVVVEPISQPLRHLGPIVLELFPIEFDDMKPGHLFAALALLHLTAAHVHTRFMVSRKILYLCAASWTPLEPRYDNTGVTFSFQGLNKTNRLPPSPFSYQEQNRPLNKRAFGVQDITPAVYFR